MSPSAWVATQGPDPFPDVDERDLDLATRSGSPGLGGDALPVEDRHVLQTQRLPQRPRGGGQDVVDGGRPLELLAEGEQRGDGIVAQAEDQPVRGALELVAQGQRDEDRDDQGHRLGGLRRPEALQEKAATA